MKSYGFIRVAAAVPAVRVADTEANVAEICRMTGEAEAAKASIVVFPELAVTGYTCGDLFSRLEVEDWLYRSLKVRYKELAPYEVVIDIQEPVSFESDTMVIDDKGCEPFTKASRIFGSDVARQFTLSLRTVSVFTPSYVDGRTVKEILDARYSF